MSHAASDTKPNVVRAIELAMASYRQPWFKCIVNYIDWITPQAIASVAAQGKQIRVTLTFQGHPTYIDARCSTCLDNRLCPHIQAVIKTISYNDIHRDIEYYNYGASRFCPDNAAPIDPVKSWQTRLDSLVSQLQSVPTRDTTEARFPPGRELVYCVDWSPYYRDAASFAITVATRPVEPPPAAALPGTVADLAPTPGAPVANCRGFTGGVAGWAASPDPLDQEIAQLVAATSSHNSRVERHTLQFSLSLDRSRDIIARLAKTGRLLAKTEYNINAPMKPIGWISDEEFDLKFQVVARDARSLSLGICAINAAATLSVEQMPFVSLRYFVDAQHRIGFFKKSIPGTIAQAFRSADNVVVPVNSAPDLIAQLMRLPARLGIEFVGCDNIRPERVARTPRPRIHFKAAKHTPDVFPAQVEFDYDGIVAPLGSGATELYDRAKNQIVEADTQFHAKSRELLASIGVKIKQSREDVAVSVTAKRLPGVVMILIKHGWHVEADGKLYRTGSRFELNVASEIDWFELRGTAHFDGTTIQLPRLLQALQAGSNTVVLDDGTLGLIPESWVKQFGALTDLASSDDGKIKFGKSQVGLLDALLAQQGEANVDAKFAAARDALRAFARVDPANPPKTFVGQLRPYQKLALGWFDFLRNLGFGGCLADDMGLGKTIQVLAMLEQRRLDKAGPSLVVVPRSLIFNWTAEAAKFAPKLRVLDQSHSQRDKSTAHLADYDLVLTTYGTLRRDAAFLKDFNFDYVILDESQAIKNATTDAAKAARLLNGRHKLALSGTPIENRLGELWSLFDFLNPGMLGRVGRFAGFAQNAPEDQRALLATAVRPFILRRTKKQVAPELPDRVEQTLLVELDPDQRTAYNELRDHYKKALLSEIAKKGIAKSQIVILEALLRLRQAACHPGLIDKARAGDSSAKIDELLERLTAAAEAKERVLVFSQFTSLLAIIKPKLAAAGIDFLYLDGKTKDRQSLVEQFQSGSGPGVFLISLKAGGVGLNLTSARSVFLLDPWWNPAVEAQAIDRAHRIGQQQTVFATRLIAADTVEQKVLELQAKKKDLADSIINADGKSIASLTREDVELLLA